MDLVQLFTEWTSSAEALLKGVAKLLAVVSIFRIGYLYHIGHDRRLIFQELLNWVGAIVIFSSYSSIYDKVTQFFSLA